MSSLPSPEPRSSWLRIAALLTVLLFVLFLVLSRGRLW
jgi:hypothetical protein